MLAYENVTKAMRIRFPSEFLERVSNINDRECLWTPTNVWRSPCDHCELVANCIRKPFLNHIRLSVRAALWCIWIISGQWQKLLIQNRKLRKIKTSCRPTLFFFYQCYQNHILFSLAIYVSSSCAIVYPFSVVIFSWKFLSFDVPSHPFLVLNSHLKDPWHV